MKRLKGAEVWIDGDCIAIKNNGGDYTVYVDPNRVQVSDGRQIQTLSHMAGISEAIVDIKLRILNKLREKK